MDREAAIAEVDWYRTLVRRRIERWGVTLPPKARAMLTENMDEVAARKSSLQFKPDREGYYIGEVDEEGLRQGYGIYTRTAKKPDRWTMQAGRWVENCPIGTHTLYESDCPDSHHYLAAVYFSGERRKAKGTIGFSLSEAGINTKQRQYRRYEYFSLSTLVVGSAMIFVLPLAMTRNTKISLAVVIVVALLYLISYIRGLQ